MVDTVVSYGRALFVCLFLQESYKVKESSLHGYLKCRYFVFTRWGRDMSLDVTIDLRFLEILCDIKNQVVAVCV